MGSTPIYNIPFAEPSDLVRDWPSISEQVALAVEAALEDIPVLEKRIEAFTGSGTWTVPAGVTYAIAHVLGGGGGGGGQTSAGGVGGSSSVVFSTLTVTSNGGTGGKQTDFASDEVGGTAGQANSGRAGTGQVKGQGPTMSGTDAQYVVGGAAVTPAASITVTVGAGGTEGGGASAARRGGAGGSGYVYIEYYEEV